MMLNSALLSTFHSTIATLPAPQSRPLHAERPRMDYNSESSREVLKRLSLYRDAGTRREKPSTFAAMDLQTGGDAGAMASPVKATRLLRDIQLEHNNIILNSVIEEASSMMLKSIQRQASKVRYEAWNHRRVELDQALGFTNSAMAKSFNEVLNTCHIGSSAPRQSSVSLSKDAKYETAAALAIIRSSVAYFSGTYSTLNQDPGLGLITSFIEALSEWSSRGKQLSPNFLDSLGFLRFLYTQKPTQMSTPIGRLVVSLCYLHEKYRKMIQTTISGTDATYLEWRERPNIQYVARFLAQVQGPKTSAVATRLGITSAAAPTSTSSLNMVGGSAPTTYNIALLLFMAGFYNDLIYFLSLKSREFSAFPILEECLLRFAKAITMTVTESVPLDADVHFYLRTSMSNLMHEYERAKFDISNSADYTGVEDLYRLFLLGFLNDTQEDDSLFGDLLCRVIACILKTEPHNSAISMMLSANDASNNYLLMSKNQASRLAVGGVAYSSLILMDFSSYCGLLVRSHYIQLEPFVAFVCLRLLETRIPALLDGVFLDYSAYYTIDEQAQPSMRYLVEDIAALIRATSTKNIILSDGKINSVALLLSTLHYYLGLSGETVLTESHLSIARILKDREQVVMLGVTIRESLGSCKYVHKWLESSIDRGLLPLYYMIGALTAEYYKDSRLVVSQLYHAGKFYELSGYSHAKYMLGSLVSTVAVSQSDYKKAQELTEDLHAKLPVGELHQVLSFAAALLESKVQLFGYKNIDRAVAFFSQAGVLHMTIDMLPQLIKDNINSVMQYSYQLLREIRLVQQQDIREPAATLSNITHQCGKLVDNSILVDIMSLGTL